MKIFEIKNGYFVRVTSKEAIELIHSLSSQLMHNNPNYDRLESYTKDGKYFSISVNDLED